MADESTTIIIEAVNKASAQINEVQKSLTSLNGSVTTSEKQMSSFSQSLSGVASSFGIVGASLSAVISVPLTLLGKAMIRQVGNVEQYKVAFDTFIGSAEKASKVLSDLSEFATRTPFDLPGVIAGGKQLLAYGFAADTLVESLTMIGNVASGVGAPLGDLVYLFGTLKASGRVMTNDLRQFAGRGIPIYEELSKVMGVTKTKLLEMVSAGKVGFPDVEQAFKNMTGEGGRFFNLMDKQSKTLQGVMSNLKDQFTRVSLSLLGLSVRTEDWGTIIEGGVFSQLKTILEGALAGVNSLVEAFSKMSTSTKTTMILIAAFVALLGPLALIIAGVTAAVGVFASTAGMVVLAFAGVGVALIYFRDTVKSIIDSPLGTFFGMLASAIGTVIKFVLKLVPIVLPMVAAFAGLSLILSSVVPALVGMVSIALALTSAVEGATIAVKAFVLSNPLLLAMSVAIGAIVYATQLLNEQMQILIENQTLQVESSKKMVADNKSAAAIMGKDYKDYYDYKAQLTAKDLAVQEAALAYQTVLAKRKVADDLAWWKTEQTLAEDSAKMKFDLALKENRDFLSNNATKKAELSKLYSWLKVSDAQVVKAGLDLGEVEAKQRIDLIRKVGGVDEKLQLALLQVKGEIDEAGVRNAIASYNEEIVIAGKFKINLAKLMATPIIQKVKMIVETPTGKLIGNTAKSLFGIDLAKVSADLEQSLATAAVERNVTKITDSIGKIGGGAGGGAASKAKTEVDLLGESLSALGVFTVREGGKIVSKFTTIKDGVEKVKEQILSLTERQIEFGTVTEDTSEKIKTSIATAFDPVSKAVDNYDDLMDKVKGVQEEVNSLNATHTDFIKSAEEGWKNVSDTVRTITQQYEELVKTTTKAGQEDAISSYSSALQNEADLIKEVADAQTALDNARSSGTDTTSEQARLDALQKELEDTRKFKTEYEALVKSTEDYSVKLTEIETKIKAVTDAIAAQKAAGTADTSSEAIANQQKLVDLEKEKAILLGAQALAATGDIEIARAKAEFDIKASGDQLAFIKFKLGQELLAIDTKKQAEIKAALEVAQVQQYIAQGKLKELTPEKQKELGITSEQAKKLIDDANYENKVYQEKLAAQNVILQEYKTMEVDIVIATNLELEAQQAALEADLTLSYNRLIVKLKEVQAAAIAALAAKRAAAGGYEAGGPVFANGGFTAPGGKHQVAGVVHRGEWVAPQWMVKNFRPLFSQLEDMRNHKIKGFEEGGFTSPQNTTSYNQPINISARMDSKMDFRDAARYLAWKLRTH